MMVAINRRATLEPPTSARESRGQSKRSIHDGIITVNMGRIKSLIFSREFPTLKRSDLFSVRVKTRFDRGWFKSAEEKGRVKKSPKITRSRSLSWLYTKPRFDFYYKRSTPNRSEMFITQRLKSTEGRLPRIRNVDARYVLRDPRIKSIPREFASPPRRDWHVY